MKSEELLTYLMVIVGYFIMIYSKCNIQDNGFRVGCQRRQHHTSIPNLPTIIENINSTQDLRLNQDNMTYMQKVSNGTATLNDCEVHFNRNFDATIHTRRGNRANSMNEVCRGFK